MLIELSLHNLRIVEQAKLAPCAGVNLIIGSNGSGKTTLLEAIYLLSRGRSFRHRETAPLIREGQQETILTTRFRTYPAETEHFLGVRRSRLELEVRLDGKPATKRSEILKLLPVQWIGPEPQNLLTGSPEVRRAFLDKGLFHVEHQYLQVLQQYNRVLEQRNAALRANISEFTVWDAQLASLAEQLDRYRTAYVSSLHEKLLSRLQRWEQAVELDFVYRRGWRADCSLAEQLEASRATDLKQRFTGAGPHRADLVLKSSNQRSGRRLSRGQLKMLAVGLYFVQSEITRNTGASPDILLFDDLSAELDRDNRSTLLADIKKEFRQAFITALSADDLPVALGVRNMFHVEHGVFRQP